MSAFALAWEWEWASQFGLTTKFFYEMGKALSGELSCTWTVLVCFSKFLGCSSGNLWIWLTIFGLAFHLSYPSWNKILHIPQYSTYLGSWELTWQFSIFKFGQVCLSFCGVFLKTTVEPVLRATHGTDKKWLH